MDYEPTLENGRLSFAQREDLTKAMEIFNNVNTVSYLAWARKHNFQSLYLAKVDAETALKAGLTSAADIAAANPRLSVDEYQSVNIEGIPLHFAKFQDVNGLIQIGNEVTYISAEMQATSPKSMAEEFGAAIRSGSTLPDGSTVFFDERNSLKERDVRGVLACGPASAFGQNFGFTSSNGLNSRNGRDMNARFFLVTDAVRDPNVTSEWVVTTTIVMQSESFKGRNGDNRYSTIHSHRMLFNRGFRNGSGGLSTALYNVNNDTDISTTSYVITIHGPTPFDDIPGWSGFYTDIVSGANNSPASSGGSFITHQGLGVGNYVRLSCF